MVDSISGGSEVVWSGFRKGMRGERYYIEYVKRNDKFEYWGNRAERDSMPSNLIPLVHYRDGKYAPAQTSSMNYVA
ncbi:MAG: hypothetical protein QMD85_04340 [Candidatus Aenigmarchaeota archaeon]|nr:hypothetical protein [Candidatus Aenigmarchaeota archaeon]MDI6722802.1 hypothetical protein [Candidatus Aenigmarchaeota archaeon]